jgi:hypothetical protein
MTKFKLIKEPHQSDPSMVTYEFQAEHLQDILVELSNFLSAAGYRLGGDLVVQKSLTDTKKFVIELDEIEKDRHRV